MVNKSSVIYNEARNNLRVKENKNVFWRVNDGDIKGKGQIRNISTTGMLLETNSNFIPTDNCRFSFDTSLGHDNFIPQNGKIVWHRKKPFSKNKYLCGIRFVEPGEYVLTKLRDRVQKGIKGIANKRRLKRVTNTVLIFVMVLMTAFLTWESSKIYHDLKLTNERMLGISQQQALLTQSYQTRLDTTQMQLASVTEELEATKVLYSESQGLLGDVRVDLELTKAVLADTEALLNTTKADLRKSQTELATAKSDIADLQVSIKNTPVGTPENAALKEELAVLQQQLADKVAAIEQSGSKAKTEFEDTIALLEEKNAQLTQEMASLQGQLAYLSADNIKSTEEGKGLLKKYKKEVKNVKSRLKHFRRQAKEIRQDAMLERDRIRLALGNQGYFMRDGETVKVDADKYKNAGLEGSQASDAIAAKSDKATEKPVANAKGKPTNRQVKIDVRFVE